MPVTTQKRAASASVARGGGTAPSSPTPTANAGEVGLEHGSASGQPAFHVPANQQPRNRPPAGLGPSHTPRHLQGDSPQPALRAAWSGVLSRLPFQRCGALAGPPPAPRNGGPRRPEAKKWRLPPGTALSATRETRCQQENDLGSLGTVASAACPRGRGVRPEALAKELAPFLSPKGWSKAGQGCPGGRPGSVPLPGSDRGSSGHGPDPGRRSEQYVG